jgi:hypothetical protein
MGWSNFTRIRVGRNPLPYNMLQHMEVTQWLYWEQRLIANVTQIRGG